MINVAGSNTQPQPQATNVPQQPVISSAPEPSSELAQQAPQKPTPEKKSPMKTYLIAGIILAVLAIGGLASLFLVEKPQDVRQQATQCVEECPGNDGVLRSCTPPESDGSSNDSGCNLAGRVEGCGGVDYCCPAPGGTWTTNMTACATPTPTPEVCAQQAGTCLNAAEECIGFADGCEKDELCAVPFEACSLGDCSTTSVASCQGKDPGATCSTGTTTGECTAQGAQGDDEKDICGCVDDPLPTTEPTAEPTSYSSSSSSSTSTVTVNVDPTQPPLPSTLPATGPEDWLKYLSAGLGALGAGAILLLFL